MTVTLLFCLIQLCTILQRYLNARIIDVQNLALKFESNRIFYANDEGVVICLFSITDGFFLSLLTHISTSILLKTLHNGVSDQDLHC